LIEEENKTLINRNEEAKLYRNEDIELKLKDLDPNDTTTLLWLGSQDQ
jgi:hypothetical protein